MNADLARLTETERYKLLMSSVVPRPVALVTTIDREGRINAAPFSCFNIMGSTPPIVVFGSDARGPGVPKDTVANVHATGEFVVNLVSEAIAEQMNVCSAPLPEGVNELEYAGLTPAPGVQVAAPRVLEAPVSLECRRLTALDVGHDRSIIIGTILHVHVQDEFYDAERGHVRAEKMRLVARMHGRGWYARTTDLFELPRPTAEEVLSRASVRA